MTKGSRWKLGPSLLLAAGLIISACGGGGGSSAGSNQSIKVGVVMPLSGPDGTLGQPVVNGVKLAAQEANAKGDLSGKVDVAVEDDQEKPEIGASVARKFCGTKDMVGVVGDLASSVTLGTQPVYNGCDLAQVTPTASNDTLTQKGFKNFFRTTAVNSDQAAKSVDFVVKNLKDVKSIATIDANDATTKQIADQFSTTIQQKGLKTVNQSHVTANATDFRGALTAMIATRPDLVYTALFVNDAALAVKQARELGYKGAFFGIDSDVDPDFVKVAGADNAEGVYISNLGYDPLLTPSAKTFVDAYKKAFGSEPNTYAANGFDAANVIIQAWKRAGGGTDRKKVVAELAKTHMQGTQGPIVYNAKGDLTQPAIGIFQVKGGKIVFVAPA